MESNTEQNERKETGRRLTKCGDSSSSFQVGRDKVWGVQLGGVAIGHYAVALPAFGWCQLHDACLPKALTSPRFTTRILRMQDTI
jgi:hypothetical protein